ncbi:hypothetical protein J8273_2452 [Carpediemonas membranifera]|uniref:Uncharacterized protein n=1 Tax=Carpediemonas membranifera TaxID=201153 RepID=A0A8J6EB31_9EUKA|nr:hypothetical protein J8273_2452 [Carpediemonas membranifera]|eukprot:KAG9396100.1 hypothetical protein J8273_2452 [Carpediemonas membranifera]
MKHIHGSLVLLLLITAAVTASTTRRDDSDADSPIAGIIATLLTIASMMIPLVIVAFVIALFISYELILLRFLVKTLRSEIAKYTAIPYGILSLMMAPFFANFALIVAGIGLGLILVGVLQRKSRASQLDRARPVYMVGQVPGRPPVHPPHAPYVTGQASFYQQPAPSAPPYQDYRPALTQEGQYATQYSGHYAQ